MRSDVISSPLADPALIPNARRFAARGPHLVLCDRCIVDLYCASQTLDAAYEYKSRNACFTFMGHHDSRDFNSNLTFSRRVAPRLKWFSLIGIHVPSLIVLVSRFLFGLESCGCAGSIEIPPAVTVVFNLLMLALLYTCCSKLGDNLDTIPNLSPNRIASYFPCISKFGTMAGMRGDRDREDILRSVQFFKFPLRGAVL